MARYLSIIPLFLVVAVQIGFSATITVEKDGSGDYTQIQPALDAAASGDTVMIGPGEFTELVPSYIPGLAWDVEVCAYVRVPNLTIIGAGIGQTILGPATYQGSNQTYSPKGMVWLDGNDRFIEGITIRNCYEGMHIVEGPLYVENCEFIDYGGYGIVWGTNTSGGYVRNSTFSSGAFDNFGLFMLWSGKDIIIENCVFESCRIDIQNIQNISFINCEMKNGRIGIEFSAGAKGHLNNCKIHNISIVGVVLNPLDAQCEIVNSEISGDASAVYVARGGAVNIVSSILTGGANGVVKLVNPGSVVIHNSHILKNGPLAINAWNHELLGIVTHDMTGNYWGTSDPDLVASWILDQNDDPTNFSIVEYLPMANGPVPTENSSWGSVKAMFR